MFEDSPVIGADRHPVTVARTDWSVSYPASRVILTVPDGDGVGRMIVWVYPQAPAVNTTWSREDSNIRGDAWTISTPDGDWTVTSDRGCGCSSPLKTMPLPWSSYRMSILR